jgi:hypothetical protein
MVFGAELHTEAPVVGLCGGQGAADVGFSSWARVESVWCVLVLDSVLKSVRIRKTLA